MRCQTLLPGYLLLAFGLLFAAGHAVADDGPRQLSPADLQGFGIGAGSPVETSTGAVPALVVAPTPELARGLVTPRPRPAVAVPRPRPMRFVPALRPAMTVTGPLTLGDERLDAVALKPAAAAASPPPAERHAATGPVPAVSPTELPPSAAPAGLPIQLDSDGLVGVGLVVRGRPRDQAP
jgi:hypothetical protein